jgi:hypothetical protein
MGEQPNACEAPEEAVADDLSVSLAFPGLNRGYVWPPQVVTIEGEVFVERAAPEQLHLVDEEGQRVSLFVRGASSVSFEGIAVGTRFWLSAWERSERPNPFASVPSQAFSLRTEQDGTVLLATLEGASGTGDGVLGLPISIQSLCTAKYPQDRGGDADCSTQVEWFEAVLDVAPGVHVAPGTRLTTRIDGTNYEIRLPRASYTTYSDANPSAGLPCAPADWAPRVELDLNVVAADWAELALQQPVDAAALPACRLGTDAPPISIDTDRLDWDRFSDGSGEFAVSLAASTTDSLEFSSEYGSLSVTGEAEVLGVLKRAEWLSVSDYYTLLFRETAEGDALVAYSWTASSEIATLAERSDVLGSQIAFEPSCDWLPDACSVEGSSEAMTLFDVVYDDDTRVPSHEKGEVSVADRVFEAWIGVTPSCQANPRATAIFVARDE